MSLFERECTLQRRHQKVVEEALALGITPERRAEMAAAARAAAQAAGYVGAGTIEFIADGSGFYFIEMNTRLQVEHPVTEMITGLDLVEWQLRVAFGESLPLRQDEITARGHAIEARIYAEDADKGFLPATGTIREWREPAGEGIRIDTGFRAGDVVTPYYDALLAKLIAWGDDRPQALGRLVDALSGFEIAGVTTNLAFLKALLTHPLVARGEIDTGFIEREISALTTKPAVGRSTWRPLASRSLSANSMSMRRLPPSTSRPGIGPTVGRSRAAAAAACAFGTVPSSTIRCCGTAGTDSPWNSPAQMLACNSCRATAVCSTCAWVMRRSGHPSRGRAVISM